MNNIFKINDNLKSCPFCGSEAFLEHAPNHYGDDYYIECLKCRASTPRKSTPEIVIDIWNNRSVTENEKILLKLLKTLCALHDEKKSAKAHDNSPAFLITLIKEDELYHAANEILQSFSETK